MDKGYLLEKEILSDSFLNTLVSIWPVEFRHFSRYSYSSNQDLNEYIVDNTLKVYKSNCEIPSHKNFSIDNIEFNAYKIHLFEIRKRIFFDIYQLIYKLGTKSTEDTYGKWRKLKKKVFKYFGKKYFKTYKINNNRDLNMIYDVIFNKLRRLSININTNTYILTSLKLANNIFCNYKGFKNVDGNFIKKYNNLISLYGYINGVPIYIHDNYEDENIFLGVKAKENFSGLTLFYLRNNSKWIFKEKESKESTKYPIFQSTCIMNISIQETVPNKSKENFYRLRIKTKN